MTLRFALLAVGTCTALLVCAPATRPSSLSSWSGCLVDRHRLVDGRLAPGDSSVLRLGWRHDHWFRTEYTAGELLIELPGSLPGNRSLLVDAATPARYIEGGMVPTYEAHLLSGTIRVVEANARAVDLLVDVRTTPRGGRGAEGPLHFAGQVDVGRVAEPRACPRAR